MIRFRFGSSIPFLVAIGMGAAPPAVGQSEQISLSLDRDGFRAASSDGAFELNAGARVHADLYRHGGDAAVGADARDGAYVRRARIELDGTVQRDWNWAAHVEFAGNDTSIKDFMLEFSGFDRVSLAVGHQKQPYSLQLEMSSNDIPFIERSVDAALIAPFVDRAIGIRAESSGESWFAAAGVFGDRAGASNAGDDGWGASGRYVYAPVMSADRVLHLGLRAAYREPADAAEPIRLRDETTNFSNLSIVDTGALAGIESVSLFGPEAVYASGAWSVSAEYNDAAFDRRAGAGFGFESWHVASTYTLGGESRASAYRMGSGEFKRLRPASDLDLEGAGRGTWELAARYARVDLNDGAVIGGSERTFTLGANWYANANVRMLLAWTRVLDTDASTPLRAGAEGLDVLSARAQFAF